MSIRENSLNNDKSANNIMTSSEMTGPNDNTTNLTNANVNDDVYVFGYGSLIWKVDFPTINKELGYIKGYKRRFWNTSNDHRGTPEYPGRVVTLISIEEWEHKFKQSDEHKDNNDIVWGALYQISPFDKESVFKHLDYREKHGYSMHTVTITTEHGIQRNASIYIATTDESSFAGPSSIDEIAHVIATAEGPSGRNSEYLLNLIESLHGIDHCPHLMSLEHKVKQLLDK